MSPVYIKSLGRGPARRRTPVVVRDAAVRRIAGDDDGVAGGVFRDRRDAVRFAAREAVPSAHLMPAGTKRTVA